MKTHYKFLITLIIVALSGCVNDDDYNIPVLNCDATTLVRNMEPEAISATSQVQLYADNTAIVGDDIIEAYVTSSDKGGNFYKTISFQTLDASFGFSVDVDVTSTFINFEPGRKVLIKLNGLYTQMYNGSLNLGGVYLINGFATIGRLPESEYLTYLNRSCTVVPEETLVQHVTLTQLKNDSYLNKLVEIDNVQFADGSVGHTYYESSNDIGGATNHLLIDATGDTLIFRTAAQADFSGNAVPTGSGTVRGILTKYGNDYQFIVRTEEDIKLTNPRF